MKKQEQTLFKKSVAGFDRVLLVWQSSEARNPTHELKSRKKISKSILK